MEIFTASIEKVMAAKFKKEVKFNELSRDEKKKFKKGLEKEVKNKLKTKAYEIFSPEESEEIRREHPEKIVKSRFVMTEKNIDERTRLKELDKTASFFKMMDQTVRRGFSEENSENLETTTPQCGRETVLSVLQILCSTKWIPGPDSTGNLCSPTS